MKGSCNRLAAVSLLDGSASKHDNRNDLRGSDNDGGISGCSLKVPTLNMAASGGPSYNYNKY